MKDNQIKLSKSILKAFNNDFYWLKALVRLGDLSKSKAGYLVVNK